MPLTPSSNEFFEIYNPNNGRSLLIGSEITIIENIDDLLSGPGMRGADTDNIYQPGAQPGSRVTSSAEYNLSFTVLGHKDFEGDYPPGGWSVNQQLRMNIEWLKAFAYTPFVVQRDQMLQLKWHGKNPFHSYVVAYVHVNTEIGVQMIGQTAAKITMSFVNPLGYWVSDWNLTSQEFAPGAITHTMNIGTPGNKLTNEFYIEVHNQFYSINITNGSDNLYIEKPDFGISTYFENMYIDTRYQKAVEWVDSPSYLETNQTGLVVVNNPLWMTAEPYNETVLTVTKNSLYVGGVGNTVDIYWRNCFV